MIWDRKYVHFLGMALEALPVEKKRLWLICFLAALGHFAAFFFIRISYPVSNPLPPSSTHVMLLSPELMGESAWRDKSLWYDMNDPSLLMRAQDKWLGSDPLDVKLLHPPEFSQNQVILPLEDVQFLPVDHLESLQARAALSLHPTIHRFHYVVSDQPATSPNTVAVWQEPLKSRIQGDPWKLPSVNSDLLAQSQVTTLRVAVNPRGVVQDVLVDSSSGRPDNDLLAVESARLLHFQPVNSSGLVWGKVTIFWQFNPSTPTNPPNAAPEAPKP